MPEGPEPTTTVATEPNPAPATVDAPQPEAPTAPPAETPPAAPPAPTEDDIYDAAIPALLGDKPTPNGATETTPDAALSEDHQQLLKRAHMTPEMIEGWSGEQRTAYFANAAKRETDTTRSYKDAKGKLDELTKATAAYLKKNPPPDGARQETPAAGSDARTATEVVEDGQPPAEMASKARDVVAGLIDVFGDEMKPLGVVLDALETQVSTLQNQAATVPLMEGMIAQMAVQLGLSNLAGDYPSLSTTGAKQQVIERFEEDWANSPHRTNEKLPHLDRMNLALADAAKAVFGNVTESAAQVTLAAKTKKRLLSQPQTTTTGAARSAPQTEDDVYDEAFEKHLAPEL